MVFPTASGEMLPRAFLLRLAVTQKGFTLIELLVTLSIVALLLALAVPRYFGRVEMAREVALRENLHQMRDALVGGPGAEVGHPFPQDRHVDQRVPPQRLEEAGMAERDLLEDLAVGAVVHAAESIDKLFCSYTNGTYRPIIGLTVPFFGGIA